MNNQLTVQQSYNGVVSNPETERAYFETLIASKKLPGNIKSFEEAYLIYKMGQDVGFASTLAFQYIVNIQGTLTINAKGIGTLLKREGYILKMVHDGAYVLEDKSFEEIIDLEQRADGRYDKLTGKRVLDRVTVIEYKRLLPNGMIEEGNVKYFLSDATRAGLTDKQVWKQYPKAMMMNRAKTKLASQLGLLFLPETEEMAVVLGHDVQLDDEGNPVPVFK